MGLLAGNGAASAILLDEVLKPRAATLLLASSTLEAPSMIELCVENRSIGEAGERTEVTTCGREARAG